ncbi:unnamed protein product [Schistosoma curassoni]|uniref:Reverse transcriptase domain-containing protein n=1 Tax=Schistosoma curassoni TaxID=6186 RepID=A0A183KFG8_9TREM|nr:unnamed protein product [Schistosoma curassoni]
MQLHDLDFADDLTLLSQAQQQMQEKTTSLAAASTAIGLNIHKGKSRILRYNTACTNPITLDGEDLEDVKTLTYLGSFIDEHGGSDADNTNPIILEGETLEDVESFTYLDSIIDEQGGSDADVKTRIGKARIAFLQLKNIWKSNQLSVNQYQSENLQYEREDT